MKDLLFATSNTHKAKAIQAILGRHVQHIELDLPEIQAIDVRTVVQQKAQTAYQLVGQPVIVEDTSLTIQAWNGLPGALIRWFLTTVGNEGICQMLESYEKRDAMAETCLGYFDGVDYFVFSGVVKGHIPRRPRGHNGFGWDPIFIPIGWHKTFAEMSEEDHKVFVSMRTLATLKLKAFLDSDH